MAKSKLSRDQISSPAEPVQQWRYDVFVSYRGDDTGKNFTDHLYSRLNDAGINTFRDKNDVQRGEEISQELLKAIRGSNICIIVFSRNYATSKWCLDELVEIMKCWKQLRRQWVLPVFYKVKPSEVAEQTGDFEKAFVKHDDQKVDKDKVSRWKAALTEAGKLAGRWDLDDTDGHEGEFIKKFVKYILSVLNHTYLHVATHPVGIDTRLEYMKNMLSVGTNDVRTVGICGMRGIGKTTIAKAVYNYFFYAFECKSFLANVRENFKQHKNQICLQEQLLSEILKTEVRNVGNVDRGIEVIKKRLCNRKVLLVLSDVDQLDQLIAFSCHSESARKACFGPGSRIIITTRHEHLLKQIKVNDIYMAEELNETESLELFCWHAFERIDPKEGYAHLSNDVVRYSKGFPLVLEVLGSWLREFEGIAEWESTLEKMKKTPHDKIQENLKISFDALDSYDKKIFLDIACFFIGMDKDYVTKVLDGCDLFATSGIGVLNRRHLVTINEGNKLMMHDLLRDMGREIVCQESANDLGQRSRLWHYEDALDVLTNRTGTNKIEGLALNMDGPIKVSFGAKAFKKMHDLRLLQLNNVNITGGYECLSEKLRWLCWHGFPLNSVPSNFSQEMLVAIDMKYSKLRQVWKGNKVLEKLKILDLSHSHFVTRITTHFSTLPNLEELILEDCRSLKMIDESIGSLDKLVLLNLKDCANLRNLPRSIGMLKSLETLVLSGCLKFDEFPEEIGEIKSLTVLLAGRTAVRQVPVSIVNLKNLQYLSLSRYKGSPSKSFLSLFSSWVSPKKSPDPTTLLPNSLLGLTSLTKLSLSHCNLSEGAIPEDIGSLSSLQYLALGDNNFFSLPTSISRLSKLETLRLERCTNLRSVPKLPSSLTFFSAPNTSLEKLPDLSNFSHAPLILLSDSSKLAEFPFTENLLRRWYGRYGGNEFDDAVFPWSEIPDWFRNQRMGNVLSFQVPPAHDFEMGSRGSSDYIVYVTNVTKDLFFTCIRTPVYTAAPTPNDHLSLGYVPLRRFEVDSGDEVEIEIDTCCELIVKKCGVIPVYIEDKKRTKMNIVGKVNQFSSSSCNDSVIVVDEGRQHEWNKGKRKREHNDEAGLSRLGEKGKRKCYDEAAGSSHYWSYEEDTLSTYEMEVFPQSYSRRSQWLRDLDEDKDGDDFICDEDNDNKLDGGCSSIYTHLYSFFCWIARCIY
ncbi:disease resistance protein RUN1-like [Cornus florida]|uniref:disease resistance protein RUN1-like n=1 Tax=Cornus florida TaxID=4283 RepID=UPI0028A0A0FE|nr:disease resistance protein RUN1-like [Cornus florida]